MNSDIFRSFGLRVLAATVGLIVSAPLPAQSFAADYPLDALAAGEEGSVELRFDVTETGAIENCAVVRSTASPTLIEASCRLILGRARYSPARDEKGRPLRSTLFKTITWKIPRSDAGGEQSIGSGEAFPVTLPGKFFTEANSLRRLSATLSLDVDETGKLVGCSLTNPTGSARVDAAVCKMVRKRGVFKPAVDRQGRPARATVLQPAIFLKGG